MKTTLKILTFSITGSLSTVAHGQTNNTATGIEALTSNTTGSDNTATGRRALFKNTTGYGNTATGSHSLRENVNGTDNTAAGYAALSHNTVGFMNTAVGRAALRLNTNGFYNVALGANALYDNDSGIDNVAIGVEALTSNFDAPNNTAVGSLALRDNVDGRDNTAVGFQGLALNVDGEYNTAVGTGAMTGNTSGSYNTAVGSSALYGGAGSDNTAIGRGAMWNWSGGSGNVALGASSMATFAFTDVNNGDNNTAVGYRSGPATTGTFMNTGAFGFLAEPTASNTIRIGNSSIISIGGQVAWSNLSDARFKTNVQANVPGIRFIEKLRPVTFTWDIDKLDRWNRSETSASDEDRHARASKVHTGFLAQEVEGAAKECGFDFSGVVKPQNASSQYELQYSTFVVPLVRAVQEQQAEIDGLRTALHDLKSARPEQHASLFGHGLTLVAGLIGALLGLAVLFGSRRTEPG